MARENPLETFFDMVPGTVLPVDQRPFAVIDNSELVTVDENGQPVVAEPAVKVPFRETLDDEDILIADQLQSVFDKAIAVFHTQQEMSEMCDPKFSARNSEVSGSFLITALNAIQLRAKIKSDKAKNAVNISVGAIINGDVNNGGTSIKANRNDLLKLLHAKKNDIDGNGGLGSL